MIPRGPCDRKNSIPIENFNPGSKCTIPIEIFKRNQKFQSRSFHLRGPRSVQKRARSKISIRDRSLEIFNPEGRDRIFSIPGPSGFVCDLQSPGRLQNRKITEIQKISETSIKHRILRFCLFLVYSLPIVANLSYFLRAWAQRDPPCSKAHAIVNLPGVANSLSHSELQSPLPLSSQSRKNSKTQSSLNFLQPGPRKFTKSDFSLLTFYLLSSEDFWVFFSFLSARSVFVPSDKCAESAAIAEKSRKTPEILTN